MNQQTTEAPSQTTRTGRLRKFLESAVKFEASDVLIRPQLPVKVRLKGALKNLDAEPFSPEELDAEVRAILTDRQAEIYDRQGSVDLAYDFDEDHRFRVNVFQTRGRMAIAARLISSKILSFEDLYLPSSMRDVADAAQGLILLCGVTGSGKSTTIASMLQQINETRPCHILTIEDPIEFIFKDAKAVVNQREIGQDTEDFASGLRAMVRENPDVVLIGELRDRETFQAAVQAAETGHLVFGTVHASSASQAFARIYNLFPENERDLIREMFAYSVRAVIYQRLVKTLVDSPSRVPAVEVLRGTPVVRKYILDQREGELGDVIRDSENEGMIDYTACLADLVNRELVHPKTALSVARNADELRMRMKGISTG